MSDLRIARGFSLPLDIVTEAIGIVATRGAGKSFTSAVVLEEAHAAGVPFVVIDPNGVFFGLRSNAKGDGPGLPVYVLGGPHGDLPLEPAAGKLIADLVVDSGHSFVLDLSDLLTKAAARGFVADFLEHLHRRKARARTTLLLVVDEADEFAPQNPRGETARSLGAMETIAKRGRAWGLGIVMITQRTQALNKDVLDLIETLIAMRQLSERSRAAVKGWIADKDLRDEAGVMESLQSLPTGTAWVWSPLRGLLQKVAVRRIRTFDSYATPRPGEARVEPQARRELDLDALGEQMRQTVERQKANDPRELQKRVHELENFERQRLARIAELEAELADEFERSAQTVEVEKIVEVPVLTEAEMRAFAQIEAEIAKAGQSIEAMLMPYRAAMEKIAQVQADFKNAMARFAQAAAPAVRQATLNDRAAALERRVHAATEKRPVVPRVNGGTSASNGGAAAISRGGDVEVKGPEQKILDALGWFEALGVMQPTRVQVGLIAGYSQSGGFANLLGKLKNDKQTIDRPPLVDYPSAGLVALTAEGRALATDPGLPSTDEGVQAEIYARLPGPQRRLLEILVGVWPNALSRAELAERAGYQQSGGFANLLGKLRTSALIDYPDKGHVRAEDVLFPMSVAGYGAAV